MAEGGRRPRQSVHNGLDVVMDRGGWVPSTLVALMTATSGVFLATIGDLGHTDQIARFWIGAGLGLAAAVLGIVIDGWRRKTEKAQQYEVTQAYVALSHAVQPLSEKVAEAATLPLAQRKLKIDLIVERAAASMLLLLKGVDGVRAVVYKIDDSKESMTAICHLGRHDKPRPLRTGDGARGDRAFALVKLGKPELIEDTQAAARASDNGYLTYISVPMRAGNQVFGLLNVDAPNANDLSEADVSLVQIIATILATALATVEGR